MNSIIINGKEIGPEERNLELKDIEFPSSYEIKTHCLTIITNKGTRHPLKIKTVKGSPDDKYLDELEIN